MNPGEFVAFVSVVVVPAMLVLYIANRFFRLREKKLEIEAINAAEKAAQYASHSRQIEERLRIVEQIVTDGGAQTAAQIEALRTPRETNQRTLASSVE